MFGNWVDEFKDFWKHPWKGADQMSVPNWFALFGMFVVISIAWGLILRAMR